MANKKKLIEQILARLDEELLGVMSAAKAAHEAATHEESKAEDSHDTRGLEASYLAGAQASRVAELKQLSAQYRLLPIREFKANDSIEPGALIELDLLSEEKKSFYFLVKQGGGLSLRFEDKAIQVITPLSLLGEALLGKKVGDFVEVETPSFLREYEVVSIS